MNNHAPTFLLNDGRRLNEKKNNNNNDTKNKPEIN